MSTPLRVAISGASSGIGAAVARALAERGHSVYVCARRPDRLAEMAEGSPSIRWRPCDVADEADVMAFARWVTDQTPVVDALINGAGAFGAIGRFEATDSEQWFHTIRVNLFGAYLMTKHLLPALTRSGDPRVVNFSGGGAFGTFPHYSAYAVSKSAVVRLTECLAVELADRRISVNAVAPGFVATAIHDATIAAGPDAAGQTHYERTQALMREGAVPLELATECVLFLVSPEAHGLTGKTISASFDPWRQPVFSESIPEINASDLYTMRRVNPEHLAAGHLKARLG